ncbi:MAG: type IV secretory system conjugative DNA transfer family protein [Propionibacteriaceae bacterium]
MNPFGMDPFGEDPVAVWLWCNSSKPSGAVPIAPARVVAVSRDAPDDAQQPPPAPHLPRLPPCGEPELVTLINDNPGKTVAIALVGSLVLSIYVGLALVALYVGLVAYHRHELRAIRGHHENDVKHASARHAEVAAWWEGTRPATVIARSIEPLRQLRAYVLPQASAYVGIASVTKRLVMMPRNCSILLMGPTTSGKTTGISIPMQLAHTGPLVSASTKPDAINDTYLTRSLIGRVWNFDPSGQTHGDVPEGVLQVRWSPLWASRTWDDAMLTAAVMVSATKMGRGAGPDTAFWTEASQKFIAPLLYAAAIHQDCTILDVREWVNRSDFVTPLSIFAAAAAEETDPDTVAGLHLAIENLRAVLDYDPRLRSGVMATAHAVTSAYNRQSVNNTCKTQNLDPDEFVRSTDTIYIYASAEQQHSVAPVVAAFIHEIARASEAHNRAESFTASSRPSTMVVLDEAANMAPVQALPSYVSQGGSQGLQIVVCLQTLSQALEAWPVQGRSLIELFGVRIALGGLTDDATLNALSALGGDYDREYESHSWSSTAGVSEGYNEGYSSSGLIGPASSSHGSNYGTTRSTTSGRSVSYRKERRITPGDISSLEKGTALVYQLNEWRKVDLVGSYQSPWREIIASTPPVIAGSGYEPAVLIDQSLRRLPPTAELLASPAVASTP